MSPDKTKLLHDIFPNLYGAHGGRTFFECADGWYDLLWQLSEKLEPLGVKAVQVKEKFGGLRFYVDGAKELPSAAYDAIAHAEDLSSMICEVCGDPGVLEEEHGWLRTLCPNCRRPL